MGENPVFFPASGARGIFTGVLFGSGQKGSYWSVDAEKTTSNMFSNAYYFYLSSLTYTDKDDAMSIRCIADKE